MFWPISQIVENGENMGYGNGRNSKKKKKHRFDKIFGTDAK